MNHKIISAKSKDEIVQHLKKTYGWKGNGLRDVAKKLNKGEMDILQILFYDCWFHGRKYRPEDEEEGNIFIAAAPVEPDGDRSGPELQGGECDICQEWKTILLDPGDIWELGKAPDAATGILGICEDCLDVIRFEEQMDPGEKRDPDIIVTRDLDDIDYSPDLSIKHQKNP